MLVEYIKKTNKLTNITRTCGVVIAEKAKDGRILFGWSKYACNKEDVPFSKAKAMDIAVARGDKGNTYEFEKLPYAVQNKLLSFNGRCKRYYKEFISNLSI